MHLMKVRFWEEIQKSERRKARMKFIKGMFKEYWLPILMAFIAVALFYSLLIVILF